MNSNLDDCWTLKLKQLLSDESFWNPLERRVRFNRLPHPNHYSRIEAVAEQSLCSSLEEGLIFERLSRQSYHSRVRAPPGSFYRTHIVVATTWAQSSHFYLELRISQMFQSAITAGIRTLWEDEPSTTYIMNYCRFSFSFINTALCKHYKHQNKKTA